MDDTIIKYIHILEPRKLVLVQMSALGKSQNGDDVYLYNLCVISLSLLMC